MNFKASGSNNGAKIAIIRANSDKYSVSAMCKFLKISRSLFYYNPKSVDKREEAVIENLVISEFNLSKRNYGTRKLKVQLKKQDVVVSRRKIGCIMAKYGLVSNYTIKQFKIHKTKTNHEKVENIVNRQFDDRKQLELVISDLTYVNVAGKWNYICLLIDVSAREIIGHSVGKNKDAELVKKAFYSVKDSLKGIEIFHTDRGSEFKNLKIDEILKTFEIKRSLSSAGCPYDNAVAEATYKIIKTEFAFNKIFRDLEELEYLLFDYVHWYNNVRIHGSLGYMTPVEYKNNTQTLTA